MKIAVPSLGETLDSFVSKTFGRSPFIIIYDSENRKYHFYINKGLRVQDGSGLKAVEIILNNNVNVLLTKEIGHKAYSALMEKHIGIHLLKSDDTVKSVIKKFLMS
jgi:predicted Fe-Mo cluster-binding NifX family protein